MKFGVIGFGNMGGAIVRGALKKGTLKKEDINVYDILDIRNSEAEELGLHVCADDEALCAVRLLPNTPALVFEGAFGLCKETDFKDDEKGFAVNLFESIGIVEWVKEYDIDAICGLSGGGPAYAAMFIEALADGGVKQGLTRPVAMKMAAQTVLGTAKLILETGIHPGELKDMVSSPAGTTIEGVEKLEEGGRRSAVMKAVVAATDRSREL